MKTSNVIKFILALSFCLVFSIDAYNQNNESSHDILKKNSLFGTLSFGLLKSEIKYYHTSLQYERIISQKISSKNVPTFLRMKLGRMYNSLNGKTRLISEIQYGLLLGANRNKIDVASGLLYIPGLGGREEADLHISLSVGWRNQKPGKSFFYRIGTGLPNYLNFGIGWSF